MQYSSPVSQLYGSKFKWIKMNPPALRPWRRTISDDLIPRLGKKICEKVSRTCWCCVARTLLHSFGRFSIASRAVSDKSAHIRLNLSDRTSITVPDCVQHDWSNSKLFSPSAPAHSNKTNDFQEAQLSARDYVSFGGRTDWIITLKRQHRDNRGQKLYSKRFESLKDAPRSTWQVFKNLHHHTHGVPCMLAKVSLTASLFRWQYFPSWWTITHNMDHQLTPIFTFPVLPTYFSFPLVRIACNGCQIM